MKSISNILLMVLMAVIITGLGCSGLTVSRPEINAPPNGIRVYPPKVYLFADGKGKGTVFYLPDYGEAYDVKPFAFLMKQEFNLKMSGGQVTELTDSQDPTPFFNMIQGIAQKALELPKPVGGESVSVDVPPGVYVLNKVTGQFDPVTPFQSPIATQKGAK
ncbi:MAG: hypothetical protein ACYC6G_07470 [Desulfobaccales bacterium]